MLMWRYVFAGDTVPVFDTVEDCKTYSERVVEFQSNPARRTMTQFMSIFAGWQQLREHVFPVVDASREAADAASHHVHSADLSPLLSADTVLRIRANWALPPYRGLCAWNAHDAAVHTWTYLYRVLKFGVFVRISGGRVVVFAPFVNPEYVNDWSGSLRFSSEHGDVGATTESGRTDRAVWAAYTRTYLPSKHRVLKYPENVTSEPRRWWLNGNVVCNVESVDLWSDAFLPQLRHMLDETCAAHVVPDCEFFMNKRDFPQLRRNSAESPYQFIYPTPHRLHRRDTAAVHAPVFSFYGSPEYADVCMPTAEDWELATGKVFPPFCVPARTREVIDAATATPWSDRVPTAVFRGSATGGGVTVATNPRLAVAALSHAGTGGLLDAGVVSWNVRDKKMAGDPCVRHIDPAALQFPLVPKLDFAAECRFKYQLYINGHCAANRLGKLMVSGSCIIRVSAPDHDDVPGGQSWLTAYLRPYDWQAPVPTSVPTPVPDDDQDHIECTVATLLDAIAWCRANDAVCAALAANARSKAATLLSPAYITAWWHAQCTTLHEQTLCGAKVATWFGALVDAPDPMIAFPPP